MIGFLFYLAIGALRRVPDPLARVGDFSLNGRARPFAERQGSHFEQPLRVAVRNLFPISALTGSLSRNARASAIEP